MLLRGQGRPPPLGKGDRVVALDPATGELRWEKPRNHGPSWASPSLIEYRSTLMLLLNADGKTTAYDAGKGEQLWESDDLRGEQHLYCIAKVQRWQR
jgi:outer membrane protein assembly factor BamB